MIDKSRADELTEKWKLKDFDVITDNVRDHVEFSMWLEPFTSEDADKMLKAKQELK